MAQPKLGDVAARAGVSPTTAFAYYRAYFSDRGASFLWGNGVPFGERGLPGDSVQ